MSLTNIEIQLVLRGLELLQNVYESDIDDCTHPEGYEDTDACRRAEIGLAQTQAIIEKIRTACTQQRSVPSDELFVE